MTGDGRHPDGDEERRYRLKLGAGARSLAWVHARASVPGLVAALGLLNGGAGPMDVRVVPWGGWPVLRADMWVEDAECLTNLFTRHLRAGEPDPAAGVAPAFSLLPEDGRGPQDADDMDTAELNPGWFALHPGVKHFEGYRRASAAAEALDAVIRPTLLAGPMAVKWDTWEDGHGTVSLDLERHDAVRLTAKVGYLWEKSDPDLCARV
jgi:hypothetical protein